MNNMNSMKPYLTDAERAEKMEKLAGYKEAVEILDECDRLDDVLGINPFAIYEWCENHPNEDYPFPSIGDSYGFVKTTYPAAYAYIDLEQDSTCAYFDREIKAIYRYAMDRILSGDDPETVVSEAYNATVGLRMYRADPDNNEYQDVPKRPCSRDEQDAYFREIALYFTARAMTVETVEETIE